MRRAPRKGPSPPAQAHTATPTRAERAPARDGSAPWLMPGVRFFKAARSCEGRLSTPRPGARAALPQPWGLPEPSSWHVGGLHTRTLPPHARGHTGTAHAPRDGCACAPWGGLPWGRRLRRTASCGGSQGDLPAAVPCEDRGTDPSEGSDGAPATPSQRGGHEE